jgi:hypothetical protein
MPFGLALQAKMTDIGTSQGAAPPDDDDIAAARHLPVARRRPVFLDGAAAAIRAARF